MYNFIYQEQFIDDKNNNELYNVKNNLFTPEEAFNKGTIFKTLYMPYKTYQPGKINYVNEKDRLMKAVQMYALCLNDINLYLAVYPNDRDALRIRKEYYDKYKKVKDEYINKYSTFTLDYDFDVDKGFCFSIDNFPWNKEVNYK